MGVASIMWLWVPVERPLTMKQPAFHHSPGKMGTQKDSKQIWGVFWELKHQKR